MLMSEDLDCEAMWTCSLKTSVPPKLWYVSTSPHGVAFCNFVLTIRNA
jgi:hypothetical protein